ncbi:MAG: AAA family ATPase [Aestuariivita sp.]|nr:AAA family ATPase [Aestuariivita sp.]
MTTQWKFYGRQKELRELHAFVDNHPRFDVLAIRGRRQVGKSDLIQTFHERQTDHRSILCKLEDDDRSHDVFYDRLFEATKNINPRLIAEFTVSEYEHNNRFSNLTEHLLQQGCVVVLDEFQNIGNTGNRNMQSQFQHLIDRVRRRGDRDLSQPHCRLILLGSEQQRLWEMLSHPRAPMYQRVDSSIHVQPWNFPEFKEMALDQGWDRNPDRLLTLWTAYNGLPGHWRRFWTNSALSDFSLILDDAEWTRQFLECEEAHRQTRDGAFHRQMEIELRESDRAIVRWLAEKPEGRNLTTDLKTRESRPAVNRIKKELQKEHPNTDISDYEKARTLIEEAIEQRLSSGHLGLLQARAPLDSEDRIKWSVSDNFARFQLQVLEKAESDRVDLDLFTRRRRQSQRILEGYGLESLCQAALRDLTHTGCPSFPKEEYPFTLIIANPEITGPKVAELGGTKQTEFDALIRIRPRSDPSYFGHLWIISVKRGVTRHDAAQDIEALDRFFANPSATWMKEIFNGGNPLRYQRHYMFVSPVIEDAERSPLIDQAVAMRHSHETERMDHWYCMDIADMMSGRGPQPLPLPEPRAKPIKDTLSKE